VKDRDLELNSEHMPEVWARGDLKSVLSDEELIERARKHVPTAARKQRYAGRGQDINDSWDLTRALLRQIDTLAGQLTWAKRKNVLLMGLIGGAAAKGIEVGIVYLLSLIYHK
jgi:hypothetical protein